MPIVIAGAGPTGLTLALLLSRLRIPSLLVDRAAGLTTHPQVSHLCDSSLFASALSIKWSLQPEPAGLHIVGRQLPAINWADGCHKGFVQGHSGRRLELIPCRLLYGYSFLYMLPLLTMAIVSVTNGLIKRLWLQACCVQCSCT